MLRRILLGLGGLALVLVLVLAVNTLRQGSRQVEVAALQPLAVDEAGVAARLAEAIQARTISAYEDPHRNEDQFLALQSLLVARYPRVHALMRRERVGGLSLLYTWPGSDASLRPILLMAHQDVVPVSPGTEADWTEPPFAGTVKDGYVWGRGAWDDKSNLIAEMEALERLAADGFRPRRSIHLAFGADEEVGGERGAGEIAKLLASRGERLDFVLDEGLLITHGILPGLDKPAALVGIAEKGYLSARLRVSATPGHSSMPPPPGRSAIAMLGAALQRIDANPLPGGIRGVAREMFETLAPEMSGLQRVALSNLWLFGPMVRRQLESEPSANATLRTTTALTMVHGGDKDNVLPGRAEATINFRLLPGDSASGVMSQLRATVDAALPGAGERIQLAVLPGAVEPSAVSPTQTASYQLVQRSIREVFPGTLVAPGLMIGATDSHHFEGVAEQIYRFSPVHAQARDLSRFHGSNERLSTRNLADMVRFYHRLVSEATR